MKIIRISIFFVVSLLLLGVFLYKAAAVTVEPGSGTAQAGGTSNLILRADPLNGETLVRLRLSFVNATVIAFSANSALFPAGAVGECAGNTAFTATTICASLAATSAIPDNAQIGTVTVRWGSSGTATITATTGNLYYMESYLSNPQYNQDPDNIGRSDVGLKATYTIGTTGTTIPNTPLSSAETERWLRIGFGAGLILLGIYLKRNLILKTHSDAKSI